MDDNWVDEMRVAYELFDDRERRRRLVFRFRLSVVVVLSIAAGVVMGLWLYP